MGSTLVTRHTVPPGPAPGVSPYSCTVKSISVDLPEKIAEELSRLVETGWFRDEGEAVRVALVDSSATAPRKSKNAFSTTTLNGHFEKTQCPAMKRIVCDTGPLLHLGEAGVRDLLSPAGDVHIPLAVDLELRSYEVDWSGSPSGFTSPYSIPVQRLEARSWRQAGLLHYGEAQAIALTRQLRADWLLTDDAGRVCWRSHWAWRFMGLWELYFGRQPCATRVALRLKLRWTGWRDRLYGCHPRCSWRRRQP